MRYLLRNRQRGYFTKGDGVTPDTWDHVESIFLSSLAHFSAILDSVGSAYLPYLCANAEAWKASQSHFNVTIEGAPYRNIRTARYRVW